ncbi:acyltransferase [Microbacterium sp. MEC084]|uniref:acyltransferase n=1 Tax=Microbacterium sp. MEC084 TaxID=1963027 RepID=UPI001430E6D9|nr:DapH/DapD/GlmU-related protein [Microbacterium sp. MEC084]MCD1269695.1 acyltransferase [Microbacterium sp. MEC084]
MGGNGPRSRIDPTATIGNAHINATSGIVTIGRYSMLGPGVSLVAGTHDMSKRGVERKRAILDEGHDITIGNGVFIGSNATVIGPCRIGDDAVIAAGSVVTKDVPAGAVVAGVPARIVRRIDFADG